MVRNEMGHVGKTEGRKRKRLYIGHAIKQITPCIPLQNGLHPLTSGHEAAGRKRWPNYLAKLNLFGLGVLISACERAPTGILRDRWFACGLWPVAFDLIMRHKRTLKVRLD